MYLCQLCELDRILPYVCRKVRVLEEYVSRQPLVWVSGIHVTSNYPRLTIPSGIVLVNGRKRDVTGINSKGLLAKCERKTGIGRAGYREGTVSVLLSPGDAFVNSLGITFGNEQEGGSSIQDCGTAIQTEIISIHRYGVELPLPKALLVNIIERDQRVLVKFAGVHTAQRGLAVVLLIGETRNLE